MRIPDWTPELKPQPQALVDAILARRGGTLLNLDKALLWSEPVARGWNVYLKAVRTELPTSRKLRELGICTVALLTVSCSMRIDPALTGSKPAMARNKVVLPQPEGPINTPISPAARRKFTPATAGCSRPG
jgi:hypothetical protein